MTLKTEEYLVDIRISLRIFCVLDLNSKNLWFYIYLAVEFYSATCPKCPKPLRCKHFGGFLNRTAMVTSAT